MMCGVVGVWWGCGGGVVGFSVVRSVVFWCGVVWWCGCDVPFDIPRQEMVKKCQAINFM